ncbi:sigma-70 family RNA polymerase sigma factor [[Clostridium] innocuum]|nr:sigma-70 family RNA polymerase sigma factor [[Clostridium] innocuum]
MKYAPRKVYIKENGGYTELSYEDFCCRREADGTYKDKFFIPVQGCLIETEQTHYIEFYRDKERWRYLQKLDADNSLMSLEAIENADDSGNGFEFIADEAVNVAETVVRRMMLDKLKSSLTLLSEEERTLIQQHFYEGKSQVELSRIYGINQSSVSRHIMKILQKLKKLLEN